MTSRRFKGVQVMGAVSGLALVAQSALAGPAYGFDAGDRYGPRHRDERHVMARVVDVDPIVSRVRIAVPVQQCWNEMRYEEGGYRSAGSSAGATLVGGLLGAVIGNQFGHGDGRRAATVAGAAVGAAVGNSVGRRQHHGHYEEPRAYEVEQCRTRHEERFEERVEGYRVTYVYGGRRYVTQTPYEPGRQIRVRVNVRAEPF